MSSTIIDSLVVTLGLDGGNFLRGAKQATEALDKLRDSEELTEKQREAANKKYAEGIKKIKTEILGFLLVLGGANSLKNFIGNIVAGDAATGRLANNLGIATDKLSAWEQAVTRVGGSKGNIDGSLSSLSGIYQNYQLRGDLSRNGDLAGLGLSINDLNDPTNALLKLADASKRFSPREFSNRASALGIDQNTINLLEQGRGAVERYVAEAEKNGAVTARDAEAAEQLQSALAKLAGQIQGVARPELTKLVEGLLAFNDQTHVANLAVPLLEGLIAAIGVEATVAYAPVVALGVAISGLIIAWQDYQRLRNMTPEQRKQFDARGAQLRGEALGDLAHGDVGGAIGVWWKGFSERAGLGSPASNVVNPAASTGAGGNIEAYLRSRGFTPAQAQGIAAGIYAESGGNPRAFNSAGGGQGAYGIGQWRGPRQRRLFARYGRNPSLQQQLEFLVSELNGGDPGGASVRGATSAQDTLSQYVWRFMRPGNDVAGGAADMRRGAAYLAGNTRGAMASSRGAPPVSIGSININTAATDAKGIASELPAAIRARGVIYQADTGLRQ